MFILKEMTKPLLNYKKNRKISVGAEEDGHISREGRRGEEDHLNTFAKTIGTLCATHTDVRSVFRG